MRGIYRTVVPGRDPQGQISLFGLTLPGLGFVSAEVTVSSEKLVAGKSRDSHKMEFDPPSWCLFPDPSGPPSWFPFPNPPDLSELMSWVGVEHYSVHHRILDSVCGLLRCM